MLWKPNNLLTGTLPRSSTSQGSRRRLRTSQPSSSVPSASYSSVNPHQGSRLLLRLSSILSGRHEPRPPAQPGCEAIEDPCPGKHRKVASRARKVSIIAFPKDEARKENAVSTLVCRRIRAAEKSRRYLSCGRVRPFSQQQQQVCRVLTMQN